VKLESLRRAAHPAQRLWPPERWTDPLAPRVGRDRDHARRCQDFAVEGPWTRV